jgi:hypothetical protein
MCHHYIANKALAQYAREFNIHYYDPSLVFEKEFWPLRQLYGEESRPCGAKKLRRDGSTAL